MPLPATILLCTLVAQATPPAPALDPATAADPLLQPVPVAAQRLTSFDQALRRLRDSSDDLRIGVAQAGAAAARSRQALAPLLPEFAATLGVHQDLLHPDTAPPSIAGAPVVGVRPTSPLGVAQIVAQVPIIDVSLWRARSAARAGADAEAAALADRERTLVGALAVAVIDVLAAERAADLQREGLRNALERQQLVQRTLDLGSGTRLDLVRAQQDTRLARSDVLTGREQVAQARERLGALLGSEQPLGVEAGLDMEAFLAASGRVCRPIDVAQRADVAAARLRAQVAEREVSQARAEFLPSLNLTSQASAQTVDPGPVRVPSWTAGAVLTVPLYDGGGRGARLDERRWLAESASREARSTGRDALIERARARRGVEVARGVLTEATSARDLAREADRMTRLSFSAGAATSFELVQSAQALRQAELALAARSFELAGARFGALVAEASCAIR